MKKNGDLTERSLQFCFVFTLKSMENKKKNGSVFNKHNWTQTEAKVSDFVTDPFAGSFKKCIQFVFTLRFLKTGNFLIGSPTVVWPYS